MKFTNPEITLELLNSLDVIATSPEEPTNPDNPEMPTIDNDPYESDKW